MAQYPKHHFSKNGDLYFNGSYYNIILWSLCKLLHKFDLFYLLIEFSKDFLKFGNITGLD